LLLLGIDTSTKKGILCLGEKEKVIIHKILPPFSSSQQLLLSLDTLMEERGVQVQDLKGIVVILGPGSFTGLRIGLSLAKSLAFVLGIPLVGIPAFDLWTASVPIRGIICPILEAYGDRFYAAFYRKDEGKTLRESEYFFSSRREIEQEIKKRFPSQKITFLMLGEHESLSSEARLAGNFSFFFLGEPLLFKTLLKVGVEKIESKEINDISTLVPLYISSPVIRNGSSTGRYREIRKRERRFAGRYKDSPHEKRRYSRS